MALFERDRWLFSSSDNDDDEDNNKNNNEGRRLLGLRISRVRYR